MHDTTMIFINIKKMKEIEVRDDLQKAVTKCNKRDPTGTRTVKVTVHSKWCAACTYLIGFGVIIKKKSVFTLCRYILSISGSKIGVFVRDSN